MMTVKSIDPAQRTAIGLNAEANALQALVNQRNEWLNNPANKCSKQFDDVKRDTTDMIYRLEELRAQIAELEKE